jgi:DNA-binding NtrC family response regulator
MMPDRAILVVEDHAESRTSLSYVLEKRGYRVHQAANGRAAIAVARRERLHGVVLDLKLPDMEGLSVLDAVLEQAPGIPAILVTGFGTIDSAVEAMKRGATDFLTKPIQVDHLLSILERSFARSARGGPPAEVAAEMEKLGIIGFSEPMLQLFATLKRVAPHQSTVLILGESGTGKELVARALHALGPRSPGPFVPVNCATLGEQLLESRSSGTSGGRSRARTGRSRGSWRRPTEVRCSSTK